MLLWPERGRVVRARGSGTLRKHERHAGAHSERCRRSRLPTRSEHSRSGSVPPGFRGDGRLTRTGCTRFLTGAAVAKRDISARLLCTRHVSVSQAEANLFLGHNELPPCCVTSTSASAPCRTSPVISCRPRWWFDDIIVVI